MKIVQYYILIILILGVSACSSTSENDEKNVGKNKDKFNKDERFYGRFDR